MTLVSILTPSYNQGRFIGDCITSVANQTYRPIEHVVMDGGSTDETLEVLASAPEHLRWRSEADRGQSHALNKALAESRGEIIGWLNSDDAYADRRAIEEAVRLFERYPDVGAVYGHSLMIDAHNKVLQYAWAPPHWNALLKRLTPFTQPAVFLRRSALPEPFVREDLNFVMDRDLWRRLLTRTRFERIDLIVGIDRHHGERKVESAAFRREQDEYSGSGLKPVLNRALTKGVKVGLRLRGLADVYSLERKLEPAVSLSFDAPVSLALRQGLVPRRYMS